MVHVGVMNTTHGKTIKDRRSLYPLNLNLQERITAAASSDCVYMNAGYIYSMKNYSMHIYYNVIIIEKLRL